MATAANSITPRKRKPGVMGVYLIRNILTGKCYVGSSCDILSRWRQHRFLLTRGVASTPRLQAAWLKHGEEAFCFEILERVDLRESLAECEQRWLDKLDTFNFGYNAISVVNVSAVNPRPAEWGRLISEAKKGKKIKSGKRSPHSAEHKSAISEGLRARFKTNPRPTGHKQTDEHKANISAGIKAALLHPTLAAARADRCREMVANRNPEVSELHRERLSTATKRAWREGKFADRTRKAQQ